ncbi:YitT family protein [Enterocloster asparagiformis]|uniref:YitT family protein n=1 Tax=Enterocloster asparagiformis TaxID=333367 RepID=UPI002A827B9C|nr:YitT family protein [Enterocloster asparagiformis]
MNPKKILSEWFIITFGTVIAASAVFFFLIPSHLAVGSISGLAIILANFIPLKISAITMGLNVALLVVGLILIGRDFGIKTIYTSVLMPVVLAVLEILFPDMQSIMGDVFLDMLLYIFTVSIGLAILFNRNASSGGLDIIAKLLNKYLRMDLGKAMSLAGICTALTAALVYDAKTVLLSILGTYLNGIVLDHFIFGFNIKRRVCILSNKEADIEAFILHTLHSGATIYEPVGAYDHQIRREIITIVDKNEYIQLMNYISKTDPRAFVTVYNVNEVFYRPKIR